MRTRSKPTRPSLIKAMVVVRVAHEHSKLHCPSIEVQRKIHDGMTMLETFVCEGLGGQGGIKFPFSLLRMGLVGVVKHRNGL